MTHVAVCVPSTGFWHSRTAVCLAGCCLERKGLTISLHALDVASVAMARNLLVQEALKSDATHILFIDSDMGFPMDAIKRLLSHDKDIVGVPYPMRRPPYELVGLPLVVSADGGYSDLTAMEFLGCGLLLIKATVFRSINAPWFFETYDYPRPSKFCQFRDSLKDMFPGMPSSVLDSILISEAVRNWICESSEIVAMRSEDIAFCEKARRYGFDIWGDMTLVTSMQHIGKRYNQVGKNEAESYGA